MIYHNSVLLQEACEFLDVRSGNRYIDGTVGGGGHAAEIVRRGGIVLGLDQDPDAIRACPQLDNLILVQANFTRMSEIAAEHHFTPISGVLLDLGVSAHQFATPVRGFSYQTTGPLDMRMDPSLVNTAATLVNTLPDNLLASLLADFGEIPVAKSLAVKIVAHRPYTTTSQLALVTGKWSQQAFQALRIAVNDELGSLMALFPQLPKLLHPGGRIVIISFHSLEDRLVKNQFQLWSRQGLGKILTPKPVVGGKKSKLRCFQVI